MNSKQKKFKGWYLKGLDDHKKFHEVFKNPTEFIKLPNSHQNRLHHKYRFKNDNNQVLTIIIKSIGCDCCSDGHFVRAFIKTIKVENGNYIVLDNREVNFNDVKKFILCKN